MYIAFNSHAADDAHKRRSKGYYMHAEYVAVLYLETSRLSQVGTARRDSHSVA